jgi:hypothetical protein
MNIVQIGACVGNDGLTDYLKEAQDKVDLLLLIEPMSIHNDKLKTVYEAYPYVIENVAITPTREIEEMSFYYHVKDGPNYEVASVTKQHILKHVIYNPNLTEEGIIELKVPCLTINSLFDKHGLTKIDYLYIDAEGIDDQLIMSIDFEKYHIDKIFFEAHHIDRDRISNFLLHKGYMTVAAGPWGGDCLSTKIS